MFLGHGFLFGSPMIIMGSFFTCWPFDPSSLTQRSYIGMHLMWQPFTKVHLFLTLFRLTRCALLHDHHRLSLSLCVAREHSCLPGKDSCPEAQHALHGATFRETSAGNLALTCKRKFSWFQDFKESTLFSVIFKTFKDIIACSMSFPKKWEVLNI